MSIKIFIDGKEGTTGLRLTDRLSARKELTLLTLPDELRKDPAAKKEMMAESDLVFLCLPDAAAIESAALAQDLPCRIIDASTAHRTDPDWAYGFPELSAGFRERITEGKRVAVPGCHASGFIALVYPLLQQNYLQSGSLLSCFSVTGYSGGGKKMIAEYENDARKDELDSPRQYALGQTHKHLREMTAITKLDMPPVFSPVVADFPCGMAVTLPLHSRQFAKEVTIEGLLDFYRAFYAKQPLLRVTEGENGFFAANTLAGRDSMELTVCGNDDRILLLARYDNLGKGASGAAVQCMNLMLGLPETEGLAI